MNQFNAFINYPPPRKMGIFCLAFVCIFYSKILLADDLYGRAIVEYRSGNILVSGNIMKEAVDSGDKRGYFGAGLQEEAKSHFDVASDYYELAAESGSMEAVSRILFIALYIPDTVNADFIELTSKAINYNFDNSSYSIDLLRSIVVRFTLVGGKLNRLNDARFQSVQYTLIKKLFEYDKNPVWAGYLVAYNYAKGTPTPEAILNACRSGMSSDDKSLQSAARRCNDLTTKKTEATNSSQSANGSSSGGQSLIDWIKENKGLTALAVIGGALLGRAAYCQEKGGCSPPPSPSTSGSSRNSSVARAEAAVKSGSGSCQPQGFKQLAPEGKELSRWEIQCSNSKRYKVREESKSRWEVAEFFGPDTTLGRAMGGFKDMSEIARYVCNYGCSN